MPVLGFPINGMPGAMAEYLQDLKELVILKPHAEAPLFDHSFRSKTFEERIKWHLEGHIENFGEK